MGSEPKLKCQKETVSPKQSHCPHLQHVTLPCERPLYLETDFIDNQTCRRDQPNGAVLRLSETERLGNDHTIMPSHDKVLLLRQFVESIDIDRLLLPTDAFFLRPSPRSAGLLFRALMRHRLRSQPRPLPLHGFNDQARGKMTFRRVSMIPKIRQSCPGVGSTLKRKI